MPLKPEAALRKDRGQLADMQHRHFATIATIISRMEHVSNQEQGLIDIREDVAEQFANALRSTNPSFNRERFLAACRAR